MSQKSVEEVFLQHPLANRFNRPDDQLDSVFPGAAGLSLRAKLLLQPFVRDRPQKFFSRPACGGAAAVLGRAPPSYVSSMSQARLDETNEALRFLRLANTSARDASRKHDHHDELRAHRLHSEVFADYSRIAEHVLGPLLALLVELDAAISGRTCTVPHELHGRWDMARSSLDPSLTDTYNPTIRNAITHGGVTLGDTITFGDDNSAIEELLVSQGRETRKRTP
jgi:hypothetical protein